MNTNDQPTGLLSDLAVLNNTSKILVLRF